MSSIGAMASSKRGIKLLSALVIVTLMGMVYWNLDRARHEIKYWGRTMGKSSGTFDMPWRASIKKPITGVGAHFNIDAHATKDADEMFPHFKAVTEMQGITYEEAKEACKWDEFDKVNFQYGADKEWVVDHRNDSELSMRRTEWQTFLLNELIPYEPYKDRFSGRGIVVLAGNGKSLNRLKVILRQLKRLSSKLAVEIAYWDDEMNDEKKADIRNYWPEIYFNDLSSKDHVVATNHDNYYNVNYQLKPAAVMNSRFQEVLFLDSDNVPMLDPTDLFDSDVYQRYGTLFWPDIARTRPQNPMWAITNTPCRNNEFEQESGQMMVDKRRFFYHLQLALWFNAVHGSYYNEFLLGDKDMFRFAWHALQTKYGFPAKWVTSVGTVAPNPEKPDEEPFYCGHTFAQHHPDGRVAFFHGGLLKLMPREVMRWHRAEHGGIYQVYKRSKHDEDFATPERVGIKFDGADYLPLSYTPKGGEKTKIAQCTDLFDVKPRPLDEIAQGFNQVFEDIRGYWILGVTDKDAKAAENKLFGGQDG